MNYYNLACILILFGGVVFFFCWAFEYGKTYSTSLPMPTKTPPMPKCKPCKEGANINDAPDYTKPKPPPNPPKIREVCCCCKRPMSKYWKELED